MENPSERKAPANRTLAKLTRPRNAHAFPRVRLFSLLDGPDAAPVTWVSAPAGSGKTTLVASYHDARNLPCLWYQLDEGDADAASFFHYLKLAAAQLWQKNRLPLPVLSPEYLPSLALFARRFFEALYAQLVPPFTIVFDDYHAIPSTSAVQDALAAGLAALPVGIRVLIVSRTPPAPAFSRLRANRVLATLGWDEMRFTFEETREFIRSSGRTVPASDVVRYLHEITDGWVAGMTLVLGRSGKESLEPERLARAVRHEVFDYFAAELFDRMAASTRDLLLRTAFLPHVAPAIADSLCDWTESDKTLAELCREQLFTTGGDSGAVSYRYHPLFREFLMQRAREVLGEAKCVAVQARSAALLEQAGQIEPAAELFVASKQWADLTRLVCMRAGGLFGQGRGEVVRRWIGAIPRATIEETPWLLFWEGVGLLAVDPRASRRLFELAFGQFRSLGDRTGLFLAWSAAAGATLHSSDYSYAEGWIATLKEVLAADPSYPSPEIEQQVTMNCFNILALGMPDHPDLPRLRERAYAFMFEENAAADPNLFLMTACYLATHCLWRGEFDRATLVVDTLKPFAQSRTATDLVLIVAKTMESLLAFFTADLDGCIEKSRDALRIAEQSGVHVWDLQILEHVLSAALSKGDEAVVAEIFPRITASLQNARVMDRAHYHLLVSWMAMSENNATHALRHLESVLDGAKSIPYPPIEAVALAVRAELLYRTGDAAGVDAQLEQACNIALRIASPIALYHCVAIKAALAFDRGNEREGLELLRKAMAIGSKHDIQNLVWWRPSLMTPLAVKALAAGIEVEYVQRLVRKRKLMPVVPPVGIDHWPWQIRIRTLGQFEIEKAGERLQFDRRAPQKPLALLKLLVAHGGRTASVDELSDVLWPEAEGDAARHAFKTTLQRLRKLIGEDCLPLRDARLGLDPHSCWVDAWAFESLLRKDGEGTASSLDNSLQAVGLYRGEFLAVDTDDVLAEWAVPYRERLRQQFRRSIGELARDLETRQDWIGAAALYRRSIDADDLAEGFYQHLMRCYQRLGQLAEGVVVYRQCENVLATRL